MPPAPGAPLPAFESGFPLEEPRPFRSAPGYRVESPAGLRQEIGALRAEVQRLAAEIDKLWARERGRGLATPARTARSIAGKPVRTGTRAGRQAKPPAASGPGRPRAKRGGPKGTSGGRVAGGPKRSTGAKRSTGWAKSKSQSRRSGTTPRRKGR